MWILPKNLKESCPSVPDTEGSNWDCNELALMCERALMWRSKHSQHTTWSRRLRRDTYLSDLSTRILKPSRQDSFVDAWTDSLGGIRANHLVKQDNERERKTPDTSGPGSLQQLELFDLDGASLKTSKDTLPKGCVTSCQTWASWVSEQRGEYSQRVKSVSHTNAKECSSWPTASARDWKDSLGMSKKRPDKSGLGRIDQLARAVYHQQDQDSSNIGGSLRGSLSPRWTETLMGLPVGWTMPSCAEPWIIAPTNSDSSETEWSPQPLRKHGENYGQE